MNFNPDFNFSDDKQILEKCLISYVVRSPTPSYTRAIIVACFVHIVFAIAGTILNSLILYIFWKSTKLRSKLSYFAIMLLSSADLCVVTITHFTFLLQAFSEIHGTPSCMYKITNLFSLYFFTGMSISTLLILNIERYTAIIHPIWHLKTATKRRFILIWAILWLLNMLNVVAFVFLRILAEIIVLIVISTVCCTSLVTYVSIFRVARKRKGVRACNTIRHDTNSGNCQGEEPGNMAAFLRELKMAKTYFIIIILAFACFLPPGIVNHVLEYPWNKSQNERSCIALIYTWANTLLSMNSTLNCLIFCWANKNLRREVVRHVKNIFSSGNRS